MKRPEGFDPPAAQEPTARKPAAQKPAAQKPAAQKPAVQKPSSPNAPRKLETPRHPRAPRQPGPLAASRGGTRPDAAARAELRRAARERRRYERAEVRRFTRRARNRRLAIATVGGVLVTLIGLVLVAVYSPILALRTIQVDGASRIDPAQVQSAVDGQLGTPLALIDYGRITQQLGEFSLIRSYVTEVVPPGTLIIHITERAPVGSIQVDGGFQLIDPAGVVLQQSPERLPGVPLIELAGGDTSSPAFASMVAVLLALPPELLAQVDRISAQTQDDVALVLTGVGQGVIWGSSENSLKKAALLAALIRATDPAQPGVFDVSAPNNGIFRPS